MTEESDKASMQMDKYNILDCTLRDGGYINQWTFADTTIAEMISGLALAGIDFIEVGYLNQNGQGMHTTQFKNTEAISRFLKRNGCIYLAMADVDQFSPKDLAVHDGTSIDGIRVVFYKHQMKQAMRLAKAVQEKGYRLFMQPMVTIDYSIDEYAKLIKKIAKLNPFAVSIVDSFGYMLKEDFRRYFKVIDNLMEPEVFVGFHSHNNMNLAFITAQDILEYDTCRKLILDSSLYGMGRGAGNLNTELITNYYNMVLGQKYDVPRIMRLIGKYVMPIYRQRAWGYSPYLFLTGLYHYHPNFACYLLEDFEVSVSEFDEFLHTIPEEMKTKCRKDYVIHMWKKYKGMSE